MDHFIDPANPESEEFADPEQFVEEVMERFVERVDALIEADGLR